MTKKKSFEEVRTLFEQYGWICHESSYTNNKTPMSIEHTVCSYKRLTSLQDFRNSTGCVRCNGGEKLNIDQVILYLESIGWKLLTNHYSNIMQILDLTCPNGHNVKTTLNAIKNEKRYKGNKCIKCYGHESYELNDCINYALSHDGVCLSSTYKNSIAPIDWQCKDGHAWSAGFGSMLFRDSWCPICSSGRSEKLSREIIEKITNLKFPKKRPSWLEGLELDSFNESIKLAVEYNGEQHYKEIPHFHRKENAFQEQQDRDKKKLKLCEENKVDLIIIPYTYSYVNKQEMEDFIKKEYIKIMLNRKKVLKLDKLEICEYQDKYVIFNCLICQEKDAYPIDNFKALVDECYPNVCIFQQCSNYYKSVTN